MSRTLCDASSWPGLTRPSTSCLLRTRGVQGSCTMQRIFAIGWLLAAITSAAAQPYPSRPVTMVVPFGAGGPTDILARIVGDRMRVSLGQQIVVENVTGASGNIGVGKVARATPDGYTIVLGNWPSHVVNGAIFS